MHVNYFLFFWQKLTFWKNPLPHHYTCWILFDFDLHLVYFIMLNCPVTREWDEADWLDPLLANVSTYPTPLLSTGQFCQHEWLKLTKKNTIKCQTIILSKEIVTCDTWHVTPNMGHITRHTWHVTIDIWHVVGGKHSIKISAF